MKRTYNSYNLTLTSNDHLIDCHYDSQHIIIEKPLKGLYTNVKWFSIYNRSMFNSYV